MACVKFYFALQIVLCKRRFKDFGISPLIGLIIIVFVFCIGSYYLFIRSVYAIYIYSILPLSFLVSNSKTKRNEFMKFIYSQHIYRAIRVIENLLTVIPFVLFLLVKQAWLGAFGLLLLSGILSLVYVLPSVNVVLPTPFFRKPYEFIVGFRHKFVLVGIAHLLVIMACVYSNFNLGIFSLMTVFVVCLSFYSETEPDYYVWVFRLSANAFLGQKIKNALLHITTLILPVVITLVLFFSSAFVSVLGFAILGFMYLITMVLAKYSNYPSTINLPNGILLGVCIVLPPLLLLAIPYFYLLSKKQLTHYLA